MDRVACWLMQQRQHRRNSLWHERSFPVLLGGNLLSRIGDGVHEFIFIITVLKVTDNRVTHAGIVYFFRFLPYLIFGPLGGALADRLSRRALMLVADLARMCITGVLCALLVSDSAGVLSLALTGMLMTVFRTIFQPAFQAAIPSLVRVDHLPTANALTQMVAETGGLVGPAMGAAALALGSPGEVLIFDALAYLVSALCVWRVSIPAGKTSGEGGKPTLRRLYGEFGQNIRGLLRKPQLFMAIAYSSVCIFLVGAALRILIPAMLKNNAYSDSVVGYAMSLTAFGAIVGAAAFIRVARDFSTPRLMFYWLLYGLVLSVLPVCVAHVAAILMGCFVLGSVGAFVDVVLPTNIHQLSTDANLGKNFSLFSTLANTGEALSGGLAGLLVLVSSVSMGVTLVGLLVASIAYVGRLKSGKAQGS
ncbi:MFS transporter [Verminephrobacter aporrectodeae subsp. tuberculatae]|uniref:MFS transporter n=2 Tax=Verminephrobacter aporrectodeae TaxID=1110389 RepID=UPI002237EC1C|nr:MFS transporter [Verminephrobacter aporrectodeae]MCW5221980.1 MFS transporter [Verminephrobacter aporrectodeae subsp. tuberculatae]MCW5291271.1 MFS transporter [Verminephrobacter aporrectodeae subsp. tuberculatae]